MQITPGSLLCFYTDGLIERRGQLIDDGIARLCRVVRAEPPEAACAAVMAAMVGGEHFPSSKPAACCSKTWTACISQRPSAYPYRSTSPAPAPLADRLRRSA